MYSC
jgi:hypothetical protein